MPATTMHLLFANNAIDSLMAINGFKVVVNNLPDLLGGAWVTIEITALSIAFGMVLGLISGLMKLSKSKILSFIATLYIDFFRGTPLFVQILLLYFGILPLFFDNGPFISAIIACSLNSGAYIAEIVRAGIQAVDKGQTEAARSLGMNNRQAMMYVILPQAFKIVIPPLINEFIALLKDTSLVSMIAAAELTYRADLLFSTTYEATWVWGSVAIIYFVITKTLSVVGDIAERRLATE